MEKTSNTYDTAVFDKATSPFAKRLQKLVTNPSALKDYLGCSLQAVNQYKQGTAFPKTENLIKIADYYGISVDYLLGRTDIPNMDTNMQAVHAFTGLSVQAISKLAKLKEDGNTVFLDLISLLLEDQNAEYFLSLLCSSISVSFNKKESELMHFDVDGISAVLTKSHLISTTLQSMIIENLPALAQEYKKQFSESPDERLKKQKGMK